MNVLSKLLSFLSAIFGRWSWQPPSWISLTLEKFLNSRFGKKITFLYQKIKAQPRSTMKWLGYGLSAGFVIGVGLFIYNDYLESLPQPDYVKVTIDSPFPTSGNGSTIAKLHIHFSKSAAKLEDVGHDITNGVKLTPAIPGVWHWEDDKHLIFDPKGAQAFKTDWLIGESYEVKFKKNFFPDHLEFISYEYPFTTLPLNISFIKNEFYIDPQQPKIKKAVATLSSSHPLDTEDFKQHLKMQLVTSDNSALGQSGETLAPKISFNETKTEVYIESPSLEIPKSDHLVKINVSKGVRSRRGGKPTAVDGNTEIQIPGRYSALKIDDTKIIFPRNEKFEPEQVFIFSTGIAAKSEDVAKNLKVYLLPKDHKPPGAKHLSPNYKWNSPSEVTAEILKSSEPVELKLIPSETAYSSYHSFKINVPIERSLYIEINQGLKGLGDYELGRTYKNVIAIPAYTPELLFMSQGAILSVSGDKKLPLLARNIRHVNFDIGRILPQQINFLIAKMFDSQNFSKPYLYNDVENMIMERFHENQKLPMKSAAETTYFSLDLKPYVQDNRGFFYIKVKSGTFKKPVVSENDEDTDSEGEDGSEGSSYGTQDTRLIMVTDLGMIAKHTASGGTSLFVQNLRSGLPVASATVDVLGSNGISVLSQTTDASGRVDFPKLTEYKNEKKPIAFVVHLGNDVSYLPYKLSDRQLSYSRFDVSGTVESSGSDQLTAMLFSDRGIYRPGDRVNIGLILRSKKTSADIQSLPLQISVTDPKGSVIKRESFPTKLFSLQDFQFSTHDTSPTGNYNIQLLLKKKNRYGGEEEIVIGSTDVQIEEFVPDKFKILTTLNPFKSKGWVPLQKIQAHISLKNLFGSAAENRMIKAEATLTPISPVVSAFKNYTFINPNKKDSQSATEYLPNSTTNSQGEAHYDVDLSKYSGYYLLRLRTQGFETEGGRSVETTTSVVASNLDTLVGFKADGNLNYIAKGGTRHVDLIAVNTDQVATDTKVDLVLNEVKYVSSLVKQNDETFKYQSVKKEIELKKEELSILKKGITLSLPSTTAGDYSYVIKNKDGIELNRIEFKIIGESNITRSLDRNTELQIVLNKDDFQAGEEIELQILAPYSGSGLITIERDSIYAQKWFKTSTNSTIERIKIPETLNGNAYINVTFLRNMTSSEIYMSPLSYGIAPFSVSLEKQRTKVTLKSPEKVKPGEKLEIQYSASKPSSIILYGVDEGILQVARYKTPDPLKFFFRKKALQVETFQLLDLLLPEYSLLKEPSASGGDTGDDAQGGNLNPFKAKSLAPVVFWSGVLTAEAKTKTFTYTVPEYFNGNIKIMAVASSSSGLGATDGGSLVRGDFIISPTAPVFVTPTDEIHVGMNISNQVENPKSSTDIKVSITTSEHLSVLGDKEKTLKIPQGRELGTDFVIKAGNKLGVADIHITATNGTESARMSHELSLRPAVPYETTLQAGFTDSVPKDFVLTRKLFSEKANNQISLSPSPTGLLPAILEYLSNFPYGCTEQIVSQTIPHLVLTQKNLNKTTTSIKDAHSNLLAVLRLRQTSQGGFALYDGGGVDHTAATMYVINYLLEAQDRGFETPEDMQSNILAFLKAPNLRKADSLAVARYFAQAIYYQARYSIVPSNDLNFLLELLDKNFKETWKKDSIAFYIAGTYQLLQQGDKGWSLLKNRTLGEETTTDYENYYSPGVRDAVLVQMIARHYPEKLTAILDDKNMKSLIKPLLSAQYNTLEAGHLVLAFSSLNARAEKKNFSNSIKAKEWVQGVEKALSLSSELVSTSPISFNAEKVSVFAGDTFPLFYSLSQTGYDQVLPQKEIKKEIEVSRVFNGNSASQNLKVKSGDEVNVILRLRGLKSQLIPYIVMVDLFPAGFELIRESVTGPVEFIDKREDRLVIYTHASGEMQEIKYKLKAISRGQFTVPPEFAESMYDKSIQYRGVAHKIEVQ